MMVPANAFWMIPHAAAAGTPTVAPIFAACSNQQIRALSPSLTPVFNVAAAWPISPFVASTNGGNQTGVNIAVASVVEIPSGVEFRAPSPVVASTSVGVQVAKKSTMAWRLVRVLEVVVVVWREGPDVKRFMICWSCS